MAPIADLVHERLEIADSAIYPALKPLQARYVMTVLQGMAVQGADGASRDQITPSRASGAARVAEALA